MVGSCQVPRYLLKILDRREILTTKQLWTAIFAGGILTAHLMAFRVKFAFVIGIALVSIVSWP